MVAEFSAKNEVSHLICTVVYDIEHKHDLCKSNPAASSRNPNQIDSQPQPKTIFSYLQKKSPALVLEKITELDRIHFAMLVKSEEIKIGFKAQRLKMPSTESGIKSLKFEYAEQLKEVLRNELKDKIEAGDRFSMSLDEWTS